MPSPRSVSADAPSRSSRHSPWPPGGVLPPVRDRGNPLGILHRRRGRHDASPGAGARRHRGLRRRPLPSLGIEVGPGPVRRRPVVRPLGEATPVDPHHPDHDGGDAPHRHARRHHGQPRPVHGVAPDSQRLRRNTGRGHRRAGGEHAADGGARPGQRVDVRRTISRHRPRRIGRVASDAVDRLQDVVPPRGRGDRARDAAGS